MQDTRSKLWLARLHGNGPTYASLALAALVAVELARIAMMLLAPPVRSPQPTIARPLVQNRSMSDVQTVVSAHLFGLAGAPTAQDPDHAPLSSANLVLAGTIASNDPKRGIAIISDGGPAKVYAVGDAVSGATLHSVYLDHVILDRAGSLETLLLPRQTAPGTVRTAAVHRGASTATVRAVESVRRMVEKDPGLLDQVMRTVPSYDSAAGKLRGFRAYPGRNRAIFQKLGLRPGDLVTAINGQPLDDPQHSQEVFNTIQSSDSATVTIERAGQKEDLSLNIAQIAGEATRELEGGGNLAQPPQAERPGFSTPPPGALQPPAAIPSEAANE
jgi:general secretion pathway protein C